MAGGPRIEEIQEEIDCTGDWLGYERIPLCRGRGNFAGTLFSKECLGDGFYFVVSLIVLHPNTYRMAILTRENYLFS